MLQRGAPKLGKDGKPVKDKNGKVIYEPYRIKVLNTINFKKSMHYNPFAYIHSEKDILKLTTTLIANTKGDGKACLLYTSSVGVCESLRRSETSLQRPPNETRGGRSEGESVWGCWRAGR